MLQLSTCVSVECDRCGHCPQGQSQTHRGREAAALTVVVALVAARAVMSAVTTAGWRVVDARVLCPDCGAVAACETTGHEFTAWRWTRRCGCARGLAGHPGGAGGCGLEFRYCTGCGRDESRYTEPGAGAVA